MDKVRKKIVLYAMTSIFVLLTVILAIINGVNFTMAADDADMITQVIADRHGAFEGGGTGTGDNKNKTKYRMQTEDIPQKGNELEKNADAAKKALDEFFSENDEDEICRKAYEKLSKSKSGEKLTAALMRAGFSLKQIKLAQE